MGIFLRGEVVAIGTELLLGQEALIEQVEAAGLARGLELTYRSRLSQDRGSESETVTGLDHAVVLFAGLNSDRDGPAKLAEVSSEG